MKLSLLHARRESKVKDPSTAHLKLAKMAMAAKRKAIRSLISRMTTKMRTVMTLSKLRRIEDAVANAEVVEAVVAEVVVDSTVVIMIMSNVGVAIDPSLLLSMKRNLRSRQ
jgi:3-oxoacyl-[acyl-carrier-protein] synthase III